MKKFTFAYPITIFALSAFITGCSTYSKNQCMNFDWAEIGRQEALNGATNVEARNTFKHYQNTCGEDHGIDPVASDFSTGFAQGMNQLCTAEGGHRLGLAGFSYKGTCNETTEKTFIEPYRSGRLVHLEKSVNRLTNERSELESRVSELERELSREKSKVSDLESQLRSCQFR